MEYSAEGKQAVVKYDMTRLTDDDLYLFNEGSHYRLYEKLGAHPMSVDGVTGTRFAVWAPNARQVSVTGEFNAATGAPARVSGGLIALPLYGFPGESDADFQATLDLINAARRNVEAAKKYTQHLC